MSSVDMSVNIAGLKLKNPVMTASGTFGFGEEYGEYYDLKRLGAVVVKGLTLKPRKGNPPPRTVETPAGMLNSVGLQNPGVDFFLEKELPRLLNRGACVIANISGASVDEYCLMMERLSESGVAAVELNLSCPNVKEGGIAFGIKPDLVYEVTRRVKECSQKPVIVKLSPNVTDIVEIALAAAEGGGDAVSLINTLLAMDIDINTRKPVLGIHTADCRGRRSSRWPLDGAPGGGAVDIPVIGMGGILDWRDAVQFILAGAKAVAVGTANFVNPLAPVEIIEGIEGYAIKQGFTSVEDMVGALL